MCGSCGRVPRSVHLPEPFRAPSRAERSAREASRRACPRCHKAMRALPDGSLSCPGCGITRR